MPRKLWLSAGLLAAGAALLATARFAGATPPSAGIFRVGMTGASVQIDPQLSYVTTGWWLEYATAAKLYNWSDRGSKLVPEVASRFVVSNRGKTYTFVLRKGFRFSDGSRVTARNFAYAIDRAANKDLGSPAAPFITQANGTNIVGAANVNAGLATHVSGVSAKGPYRLVIRLTRPDGSFLLKLTMPFFQATSTTLPLTHEVVDAYPSAGPYSFTENRPNERTSIRRNPYYVRGPGRVRPRNLAGVDVQWNLNEQQGFEQVMANQLDEGPLPVAEVQNVAGRFGVNKTRFWTEPGGSCTGALFFNNGRGIFRNNVRLRQAVNWAVDRTDYFRAVGPFSGKPLTHLLPPGFPGSITAKRLQPYAPTSRLAKAHRLAAGHFRSGHIVVLYRGNSPANERQSQLVRRDLIRLGFKPENIDMREVDKGGGPPVPPPADWDLSISTGWCVSDLDPTAFFDLLFEGYTSFHANLAGSEYGKKILAVRKLVGTARLRAFGKLDLEITRDLAPVAPMRTYNSWYLFSDRVDPRSLAFSGVYSDWSIPALALK